MPPKTDRRVLRTRRMLREALLDLIVEKGYDNLTITDITGRADLRRATFYLHFKDIDELLGATLQELWGEAAQAYTSQNPAPFYTLPDDAPHSVIIFEYLAQRAPLYQALFSGQSGVMVMGHVRRFLARMKLDELQQLPPDSLAVPADLLANFIAGTETAMLVWWLENDMPYPPAEIAQIVQTLIMRGVRHAIQQVPQS